MLLTSQSLYSRAEEFSGRRLLQTTKDKSRYIITSTMEKTRIGFCTMQRIDDHDTRRMRTVSENDSSYREKRAHPKERPRDDKQTKSAQCNDKAVMNENTGVDSDEETFRERIEKHSQLSSQRDDNVKVGFQPNQLRPKLQRKSHSDLTPYSNSRIKILVEGKELSGTAIEGTNGSNRFKTSLQEPSINKDHIAHVQEQHSDKNKLRSLVGWFGKANAKAYDLKNAEKISEETMEKRSPLLKRSRSFSGRIREKFKMSFTSTNAKDTEPVFQPPKSNYLQPPSTFYRNNVELNRVNCMGVTQFGFQRRYSDQTDSMSRRPLGGRKDVRPSPAYFSLDRGLRQISAKKPLTRKRSNSFEKDDDFAFLSQISDADRSRSCSARISVTQQLDTHRDNDGMLETNLCSTEL